MTLKNGFGKCSLLLFYQPKWMKRSKHRLFVFPQKNPNKEKALFEWPIVMQYDMKAKYQLISRTFLGMIFFTPAFALPTKSHACLYTFDKPIKLLYFCLFVDSVLFTCFHFKVIQKSPYGDGGLQNSKSPDFIFPEVVLFCSYLSL